ncbi:MAG: hypothetical protein PUE91_11040 [Clostridiales bacterium]|nr:hypothetical protein [Clostridiales bacterium]
MENKKKYTITEVKEETDPEQESEDRLAEDPLDHLPDVSSQTGGLPIVTFVLVCLSAGSVMMIGRALTAGSVLRSLAFLFVIGMLVFGMVALIRGMFTKLHNQQEKEYWYPLSAAIMAAGILVGLMIGICSGL